MKAIAIIAEYNPFHNGHLFHINKIKAAFPEHVIIAIMSGQFTQRGEPAFVSKFQRAQMAIHHCDLVVELPQFYAMSYADDFAYGGVSVAHMLQADTLSFGSESNNLQALTHEAMRLDNIEPTRRDIGYAELMSNGLKSNDILAVQYIRQGAHTGLSFFPVQRVSNAYLDESLTGEISSATAIRKAYYNAARFQHALPQSSLQYIAHPLNKDMLFQLLKYRIVSSDLSTLRTIYTMYEGLEYRIKKYIHEAQSYDHLIECLSTKRYTKARIRRLLTYILLNVPESKPQIEAIRVLAMNEQGRNYIKQVKTLCPVPIITNINKQNVHYFSLEVKATDVYNILTGQSQTEFNNPVIYRRP